ncbi:ubiquitin-specific protease 27 [Artemisia annua]|uniref:Ubiquitin carboxyl-terminal hydrolase n=1 Tax=Artemisia annua TaxID=35608 RepID=A0A2U1PUE5_ARTAN|nr:ubiquitin-specific protease 27 [Artemisia annua]
MKTHIKNINVQSWLNSLKHGFKIISHKSFGFQVSLAASSVLSVAGLFLAFKDENSKGRKMLLSWLQSSDNEELSEDLCLVPGLQNLGNNCFLNVVLQALASCSCFLTSIQKIVDEFEASSDNEQIGDMPLAVSLNALLQELCIVRDESIVLSPRKVMLAMADYMPNFNLTNQQDAEEALAHMLSSLRAECSEYYASTHGSLAVVNALSNRILTAERSVIFDELQRWTQSFLGPFNGIVGSILTCKSCSFQISLDFQYFNCLYLSPPTYAGGGSIIPGCSIEDCLERFFVAERLENYFCTHCWHTTALRYLSLLNKNEADVDKLRSCSKHDTCDCKNLPSLGSLPWSNNHSRTFKQLHIARCPEILCLNLQRASVNVFGEFIKLQGHISFPLTLNMSPFQNKGTEIRHSEQKLPIGRLAHQNRQPIRYSDIIKLQNDAYKQPSSNVYGETGIQEEQNTHKEAKVCETSNSTPSNGNHKYNLVSVVEHFGDTGSGHYTVYRRVVNKTNNCESDATVESCNVYWIGVSDSQVYRVSEEDVLASRASLLFYERVSEV